MDLTGLKTSLDGETPSDGLSGPMMALWHAQKGDWDRAHKIVQDDDSREASWVHAYLHRVEGDLANAGYWYRRAGKETTDVPHEEEWQVISQALLASSQ